MYTSWMWVNKKLGKLHQVWGQWEGEPLQRPPQGELEKDEVRLRLEDWQTSPYKS